MSKRGGVTQKTGLTYILAASHSGSTLLAMLLASHPEVCTVGELKAGALGNVDHYRCSCGRPIATCGFWIQIAAAMAERGRRFDIRSAGTDICTGSSRYVRWLLRPLHRGPVFEWIRDAALALSPTWRSQRPHVQAANATLAACICARSRGRVLVDSSKVGLRLKYLLRNPRLDVTVIRLIRDGRGVALTYTDPSRFADATDPQHRGGGMGSRRADERLTLAEAAREWRRSNEEADAILKRLDPTRWIDVRYETLCLEPEVTLSRLFDFLEVAPHSTGKRVRALEHHVIGNGMRLDSTSEVRLDDRWRSALDVEDLRVFDSVAGALNRQLGYQ